MIRRPTALAAPFLALLVACGGGDGGGGGGGGGDKIPPEVVAVQPAQNATAVPTGIQVGVQFSEPVACATVTAATFNLRQGATPVAGAIACNADTALLTPGAPLAVNTVYTATVTTGIKDLAGNALAEGGSWNFTTEAGGGTTFTLGTEIRAVQGQFVDVDTNDPNTSGGDNDSGATAQLLPGVAVVGGWASNPADLNDFYRATLAAGQVVTLTPADDAPADLDLGLFRSSDGTPLDVSEQGPGLVEQVTVPAGESDVVIVVAAYAGSSSYTLTFGQAGASASAGLSLAHEFVPGEFLVRFRDEVVGVQALRGGAADLASQAARLGLVPLGGALRGEPALLGLPAAPAARARALAALGAKTDSPMDGLLDEPDLRLRRETLRAVAAMRRRADVVSADPNYIRHPLAVPDDTYYPLQWHYPLIDLPQAWDVTTGGRPAGQEIIVAVVDTGIAPNHPDFTGQLVPGYDFISSTTVSGDGNGVDSDPTDPGDGSATTPSSFHGTHVAGTVAARSNDGAGVAGVSWGAKIMPVRVLGKGGGTSADIINGVRWAAGLPVAGVTSPARKADVINLSLGGGSSSATEQAEYTNVRNAGVIVIAAAGNENSTTPSYPASYANVVSVAAVDSQKARAPYSNRGPNVDIAAPGGNTGVDLDGNGYADGVLSTMVQQDAVTPVWTFYQGTSMASPHVAGVAALMKAVCPTMTPANLDSYISSGSITDDLGTAGRDDTFGWGLVNALKAVQVAQAGCTGGTPPTEAGISVDPTSLDFGTAVTASTLAVTKVGTGTLATVTAVATSTPAGWLSVTGPGGNGLGTYNVTVNRASLPDGTYRGNVTFTAGTKSVAVPVVMRKGVAAPAAGDAGYVYLLILDPSFAPLGQDDGRGTAGVYTLGFTGVPAGAYYLVAGTDSDDDGVICDPGEACGAWPTLNQPTPVGLASNLTGLQFTVGFDAGVGLQSAGPGPAWPRGGFRLPRAAKLQGGAR